MIIPKVVEAPAWLSEIGLRVQFFYPHMALIQDTISRDVQTPELVRKDVIIASFLSQTLPSGNLT